MGRSSSQQGGDDDGDSTISDAEGVMYDGIDQDCDGIDLEDLDGDDWGSDVDCDDNDASLNWTMWMAMDTHLAPLTPV